MDNETARTNMIEQQIRPWNVLEMQTLNALSEIRREDFVPEPYKDQSFADLQIPIGDGEVMLEPKIGARMVEALGLKSMHRILEIGTGTGYLTALMASLCEHVTSIEINSKLSNQAEINLAMAGVTNIKLLNGDCFEFCLNPGDHGSQFDGVIVTGSVVEVGKMIKNMINSNGRIVAIEGYNPAMQVVICEADESKRTLFETSVKRLHNVNDKPAFVF